MPHLLALDQGTTSSRTIVFDERGAQIAVAQQEFEQHYPKPGWVEHNAEEIWESQLATMRSAIRRAKVQASDIAAIGITNQRETTVLWDRRTGEPLYRAIVWQDRRTAELCDRLRADGHNETFHRKTGLLLDPYFSGTKIAWLLEHVDGLRRRAENGEVCFGTIDSWLIYRLSGNTDHLTDVSNASRTLLYNIHELDWDDELLGILDIPRAMMPEVKPSAGRFTELDRGLLGADIPITGVAGDQQAALFGQACFDTGMAKNTYGTGAFIVMNIGEKPASGEGVLTTLAWQLEGQPAVYAMEASIFIAGAAVQWLRDGLGLIKTAAEVEDLAKAVDDSGGVYFVPALTGLGAPHWDPYARGTIVGLTRGTTRAHLARATLEAMAFQTRDGIEAMQRNANLDLKELRVDGGAVKNNLLLQFQADLLETPVLRPKVVETTALGATYLAGIGADVFDQASIRSHWQLDQRFKPAMDRSERERRYHEWRRAVERSKGWIESS
ncbi:MAG: glycerol kinase [Phycisphaerales bacterium]|nr:MAG: glycerol kinase [Phycisphaerales bacterium]